MTGKVRTTQRVGGKEQTSVVRLDPRRAEAERLLAAGSYEAAVAAAQALQLAAPEGAGIVVSVLRGRSSVEVQEPDRSTVPRAGMPWRSTAPTR